MIEKSDQPISGLGLLIWSLGAVFFLYEFFLRTFVGSVASQLMIDLHLNAETFAIIGSAYYVTYGFMQIPVGILTDKFGVKAIMIFATLVCVVSTYWFAHADSFASALGARLLMGFGSSFAFICLLVITSTWLPRQYFAFFAGTSQFVGTMGPLIAGGPLILLMNSTHQTWRAMITEIGGTGLLLAALMLVFVRNKPKSRSDELIFLKPSVKLMESLPKLFADQQSWIVALYSAVVYVSIALLSTFWGTRYLEAQGLSQSVAASMISLSWLGYAIACPALGAWSDYTERRRPTMMVASLLGVIATLVIAYAPLQHAHWVYGVAFVALGIAAASQSLGFATISELADSNNRATALGLNNGAITIFTATIPPWVSHLIQLSQSDPHAALTPANFTQAFAVMPILYGIGFLIAAFLLKETYCKPQKGYIALTL